jgi:hypothetical protein
MLVPVKAAPPSKEVAAGPSAGLSVHPAADHSATSPCSTAPTLMPLGGLSTSDRARLTDVRSLTSQQA